MKTANYRVVGSDQVLWLRFCITEGATTGGLPWNCPNDAPGLDIRGGMVTGGEPGSQQTATNGNDARRIF